MQFNKSKVIQTITLCLMFFSGIAQEGETTLKNLEYRVWKIDSSVNHVSWMEVKFLSNSPYETTWVYINVEDAETCSKETFSIQYTENSKAVRVLGDTIIVKANINNLQMIDPNYISVAIRNKNNRWSKYISSGDKDKFNLYCEKVTRNSGSFYLRRNEK